MATTITIDGELRLDQSSGLTDDDVTLTNTLAELNSTFSTALLALSGTQLLTTDQKNFAADVGAAIRLSDYVTVDPDGAAINDLFFSNPDGDLFEGEQVIYDGNPLKTVDGDNIYFWSLTGNLVIATTSATEGLGEVVAAFYLDEAPDSLSAGVEMVTFIAIDHPDTDLVDETIDWTDLLNISASGSQSFDFNALKSGSSLWVAVGSEDGGVLVTGGNPLVNPVTGKKTNASDVIHTSQGGDGTTIGINNQLFDNANETGVFTLVKGLDTISGPAGATGDYIVDPNPNDAKLEGVNYDDYLNVTGAGIYISQSQGSPSTTKSFDINLFSAGGGTNPEEGFGYISGLASDTAVNVGSVSVYNDDGELVGTWGVGGVASGTPLASNSANGVTNVIVEISGNHIEVNGVFGEFTVSWTSLGGVEFNRFTLVSETGQFDVGRVDITEGLTITEPVGDTMFVDDDGPSLSPAEEDDIDLLTDDTDITATASRTTDELFPLTPDFGTDGPHATTPITYELVLETENGLTDLVDTATGKPIRLVTVGDDIVGYVDEDSSGVIENDETLEAIRYSLSTVDSDTKQVDFSQTRAVYHDTANPETVGDGLAFLVQTAFDGDGDPSDQESVDLGAHTFIEDDVPKIGPILNGIVDFEVGASVDNPLDGDTGNDPNSSPYTLTSWTTDLTINGVDLEAVIAGDAKSVSYWADTNGDTIFGNAGDTEFYRLTLGDQTGAGDYTFEVLVAPPGSDLNFDFTDLPSGQNLFGAIAADKSNLDGMALFVIAKNADVNASGQMTNTSATVNTSKGGGPVTIGNTNQMIDPGEGTYFAYVSNPDDDMVAGVPGGLTQNSADDADNIGFVDTAPATTAEVEIVQVQGGSPATLNIKAFDIDMSAYGAGGVNSDADARGFAENPIDNADPVNVSGIRVFDDNGDLIESWSDADFDGDYDLILDDPDVDVDFTDLGGGIFYATVSGVQDDYSIEFDTEVDHDLALVEGVAGKFDIGGFNIVNQLETPDQKLDFTAEVEDGDTDTATASWSIGIDGDGDGVVAGVAII